jgi:hypothetical protein
VNVDSEPTSILPQKLEKITRKSQVDLLLEKEEEEEAWVYCIVFLFFTQLW